MQPSPRPPSAPRTAFLFFGHDPFPRFVRQVEDARRELAGRADVHVIAYVADAAKAAAPFRTDPTFNAYDRARMEGHGYPRKAAAPFRLLPGNTDMPVLAFAKDHPEYDTFWLFEYDVVFTGPLLNLVDAFAASSSDLIGVNLAPPRARYPHMVMSHTPEGWPDRSVRPIRALLSAFRASRRLLEEVDRFYREGGDGHYEWSWPYVTLAAGLELEDFGGAGPFVKPGNRRRFYTGTPTLLYPFPGTFRFRPPFAKPGRRRNTLWHPIKEGHKEPLLDFLIYRARLTKRWLHDRITGR